MHKKRTTQDNHKKTIKPNLLDYIKIDDLTCLIKKTSGYKQNNDDLVSCYAFIQADGFCLRNNNLAIYAESNRQV